MSAGPHDCQNLILVQVHANLVEYWICIKVAIELIEW